MNILDIYPNVGYGYVGYVQMDIDIYPFGILDMTIYQQMDLDLGYFCFIKYPFWPQDIGYGYISIFKICGSGYDMISKKVDMTHH